MVTAAMKLKDAFSLEEIMTNLDSLLKSKEELKSFLMKVKEESEKVGLKLNSEN